MFLFLFLVPEPSGFFLSIFIGHFYVSRWISFRKAINLLLLKINQIMNMEEIDYFPLILINMNRLGNL